MNKSNRGYTLFETMLAVGLLTGAMATGATVVYKYAEEAKYMSYGNLPQILIKAVDRRIEIDGYNADLWSALPQTNNSTEKVLDFAEKAFISRTNTKCGVASGWQPQLAEASNEKLVACNIKAQRYEHYDYTLSFSKNNENALQSFDVVLRLNSDLELKGKIFQYHKKLKEKLSTDFVGLKTGISATTFTNFNDLSLDLSVTECVAFGNNCVIKYSWRSDGYSEQLRLDGSNNMVKDTISFSDTFQQDNKTCLLWEYDDSGNYQSEMVDCGIGIYNKTLKPVMATVDASVTDFSTFKPVILKEKCQVYTRDANGYLKTDGLSECGLFTSEAGTKNVIQVVEDMQSDASFASNQSMIVHDLVTDELNTSVLEVVDTLLVDSETSTTNFEILIVEDGAETKLNALTTMKALDVLTKSEFVGNVTVNDLLTNEDGTTNTDSALTVDGRVDLNVAGINKAQSNFTATTAQTGGLKILSKGVYDGTACLYTEKGEMTFDGVNILICKQTNLPGVYRWLSKRVGEIAYFDGNCPIGWSSMTDLQGRTGQSSGKIKESIGGISEYQVGQKGGQAVVQLTEAQLPSHSHDFKDAYFSEHWGWEGPRNQMGSGDSDSDNNFYTINRVSNNAGGNQAHENRMRYIAQKACIYLEGDKAHETFADPTGNDVWYPYPSEIGDWVEKGVGYDCGPEQYTDYRPEGREYWVRTCMQDFQRSIREKEINYNTGQIRLTGIVKYEDKSEHSQEIWTNGSPLYYDWSDISNPYGCAAPQISTLEITGGWSLTLFCSVDRERMYQERMAIIDSNDNEIAHRPNGEPKSEQKTFQDNYVFLVNDGDVSKTCGNWETDAVENTKPWTPDAGNYDRNVMVDQTRVVHQTRNCTERTVLEGKSYVLTTYSEGRDERQNRKISGSKINLQTWKSNDNSGVWTVASDGAYAYQSKNGNPTIFESPTKDYGESTGSVFKGMINVGNDGDDDYVGFVMGKTDANNFHLWSWKKGNQGVGKEGQTFAKVTGGVGVIGWDTHKTKPGYTALASKLGPAEGWGYNTDYKFRIEYTRTRVKLFIDEKLIFNITGDFPKGSVGFYNNSQSKVKYYKITEEPYYE